MAVLSFWGRSLWELVTRYTLNKTLFLSWRTDQFEAHRQDRFILIVGIVPELKSLDVASVECWAYDIITYLYQSRPLDPGFAPVKPVQDTA